MALALALSCEKEEKTPALTEPARLTFQNAGGEAQKVELYESGEVSTATVEFRVAAEAISANTIDVTFKADPTKVAEYNKTHGTSYEMAPEASYDLTGVKVMLARYNKVSTTAKVSVSTAGIPDTKQYLLPIVIDKIVGDDQAQVNSDGVIYVTIKKYVLKDPVLLDRSDWECIYTSSSQVESTWTFQGEKKPYGGGQYMFDGDIATWWQYNSSGPLLPWYLVIDLKKEMYIKKIILTARPQSNGVLTWGAPKKVDFAFATEVNDANPTSGDYSDFENFDRLTQWQNMLNFRGEIVLGGLYKCRYIMIRHNGSWQRSFSAVVEGKTEYLSGDNAYNGAWIAEFEAAGYTDSPYE